MIFHYNLQKKIITQYLYIIPFLLLTLHAAYYFNLIIDDAFITFRISRNFTNGNGLVYNIGIGENFEGHSNFLWSMLISGFILLKTSPFLSSKIMGFFSVIITFYLFIKILRALSVRHIIIVTFLSFFALNSFYIYWSQSGLETPLHSLLLFLVFYFFYLKESKNINQVFFSFALGFLFLSRPEAPLFILPYLIYDFLKIIKEKQNKKYLILCKTYLPAFLIFFFFMGFRLIYYHNFLPNTYYAKTWLNFKPYNYIWDFFLSPGVVFPILFFSSLTIFLYRSDITFFLKIMSLIQIVCSFFFTWYVKGDWMPSFRFLVPVLPFFYFMAALAYENLLCSMKKGLLKIISIFFLLLFIILSYSFSRIYRVKNETELKESLWFVHIFNNISRGFDPPLTYVCDHLLPIKESKNSKPYWIALPDIGYPGYITSFNILDWQGLPNKEVAQVFYRKKKGDKFKIDESKDRLLYKFFSVKPIFTFLAVDKEGNALFLPAKLVYKHPEFLENNKKIATHAYYSGKLWVFQRNNFDEKCTIKELLKKLLKDCEEEPFDSYVHQQLGLFLHKNYKKIENSFARECIDLLERRACFIFLSHYEFNVVLSRLEILTENFDQAKVYLKRSIKIKPNLWAAHALLGTVYEKKKMLLESEQSYRLATKLRPNDPWWHARLGFVLLAQDKLEEAIKEFEESTKLSPQTDFYWNYLGNAYKKAGKNEKAKECFKILESLEEK